MIKVKKVSVMDCKRNYKLLFVALMAISDLQRYPLKICLIKYVLRYECFFNLNCSFIRVFLPIRNNGELRKLNIFDPIKVSMVLL